MMVDDETDGRRCVGCDCPLPLKEFGHPLFSNHYGWRLTRAPSRDGRGALEWRCPDCFAKHRQQRQPQALGG
jgi:hypothetical protein